MITNMRNNPIAVVGALLWLTGLVLAVWAPSLTWMILGWALCLVCSGVIGFTWRPVYGCRCINCQAARRRNS